MSMLLALNQDRLATIIGSVLIFSVTAYFQYRAAREVRAEAETAKRRGKVRGYLFGLLGIIAFALFVQILYVLSVLEVDTPRWSGPLFYIPIGLIFVGFLIGNRIVSRVRKKRRL